jgi:hypothetical protein
MSLASSGKNNGHAVTICVEEMGITEKSFSLQGN